MPVPTQSSLRRRLPRNARAVLSGLNLLLLMTLTAGCSPAQNSLIDVVPCSALDEVRSPALRGLPPDVLDAVVKNNRSYSFYCQAPYTTPATSHAT